VDIKHAMIPEMCAGDVWAGLWMKVGARQKRSGSWFAGSEGRAKEQKAKQQVRRAPFL